MRMRRRILLSWNTYSLSNPDVSSEAADALVKEDIRQKIIFAQYKNSFLTYMLAFKKQCFDDFKEKNYAEACADSIMNANSLPARKIQNEVDSFTGTCEGEIY